MALSFPVDQETMAFSIGEVVVEPTERRFVRDLKKLGHGRVAKILINKWDGWSWG
jgi:hypothetical protein